MSLTMRSEPGRLIAFERAPSLKKCLSLGSYLSPFSNVTTRSCISSSESFTTTLSTSKRPNFLPTAYTSRSRLPATVCVPSITQPVLSQLSSSTGGGGGGGGGGAPPTTGGRSFSFL